MNEKDLIKLIQQGESDILEFKSNFNTELIETIVAFANTKGGKLFLGINDKGEITGVLLNNESIQRWVNEIKNKTSPGIIPETEVLNINNKKVVVFSTQEYPVKPVATRGKYFKRVSNSNHLLNISEVVNLHLQSFNTSWDYHFNSQFKIEDLSLEKIQIAIDIINQSGTKIYDDPLTFLIKNDLLRDGKITNAAFLLFSNRDSILTTIELGRFQTETIIKDSARTKSDILGQIDQVIEFIKKHINREIIITDQPRNVQKWQYPMEAIREIVINMIIHRDYRSSSDSIIKIFDDRIEFYNPGRLPDSISIEDLFANNYKSTPRNKQIADFCKTLGLIEKYGSGIKRVLEIFKQEKLPKPEFQNISEGFMVKIFSRNNDYKVTDKVTDKVTNKVTDNQLLIVKYIVENPEISTNQLSDMVGISQRKIKENISKLKKSGILKRIGSAKSGHWQVTN